MVSFDVAAKRQLEGMQRSGQRLAEGYAAQTEHPGVLAAKQKDAYVNGVNRNANKWAVRVATKHTLAELIQRMNQKGASAYSGAASLANQAYRKNGQEWYETVKRIKADIDSRLPRGDDTRNRQRADEFIRLMQEARNQKLGLAA